MVVRRVVWSLIIAAGAVIVTGVTPALACAGAGDSAPAAGTSAGYGVEPAAIYATEPASSLPSQAVAVQPRLAAEAGPATGDVVFGILALSLIAFLAWYRREPDPEGKLRAAAAAGLWALVFWSCTSALPWLGVLDSSSGLEAMCFLGTESQCSTYFAGDARWLGGPTADAALFEILRWHQAVIGIRTGQSIALFFLLPALIWLLIEPRSRVALSGVALCGFATAFALLSTLYYRVVVPSWLHVDFYRTFDVAVLSAGAIVVAIVLILVNAVRDPRRALPSARVVSR